MEEEPNNNVYYILLEGTPLWEMITNYYNLSKGYNNHLANKFLYENVPEQLRHQVKRYVHSVARS